MWTDKSKFNLVKSDGAQKVSRKEGEAFKLSCIRGTVKFGGSNVMVWRSMTWNGITIDIFGDSALLANPKKPPIWGDSEHM